MLVLDEIDKQLIILLNKDATPSSKVLAKQLNVSAATVRLRKNKLLKRRVLRITGLVDPQKVGTPVIVAINLRVRFENLEYVLNALADLTEIKWISSATGRFDILTMAAFTSNSELQEFYKTKLARISGILNAETSICLDIKKGRYLSL